MFHEDVYDALRDVVRALGGTKRVGPMLWPAKNGAGGRLRDCLNAGRQETLDCQEMLTLLKWGREIGCHSAMYYLADSTGYQRPDPVQPEDEASELMRRYIEAVKLQKQLAERFELLQPSLRMVKA